MQSGSERSSDGFATGRSGRPPLVSLPVTLPVAALRHLTSKSGRGLRVGLIGDGALPAALADALRDSRGPGVDTARVIAAGTPSPEQLRDLDALVVTPGSPTAVAAVAAATAAGLAHLVVVSGTAVYGASAATPVPIPEDSPLQAEATPAVAPLLALEDLAEAADGIDRVTVIRPGILVGPGAEGPFTAMFEAPRLLLPRGARPRWQLTTTGDLATAVALVIGHGLTGAVAAVPAGALTPDDVERVLGARRLEVPEGVVRATADRLARIGVTRTPVAELAYLTWPWEVAAHRLAELGWQPVDNAAALAAHADLHGLSFEAGRVRPAVAGAGTTVALVGTAALLRRARRRRRV